MDMAQQMEWIYELYLVVLGCGLVFLIARFMEPKWGPPGSCRPQMGPILAPWTLLLGLVGFIHTFQNYFNVIGGTGMIT